jgi:hypothetical protein
MTWLSATALLAALIVGLIAIVAVVVIVDDYLHRDRRRKR